jgi:hypothetical protein
MPSLWYFCLPRLWYGIARIGAFALADLADLICVCGAFFLADFADFADFIFAQRRKDARFISQI